jgi:hypothetical protein
MPKPAKMPKKKLIPKKPISKKIKKSQKNKLDAYKEFMSKYQEKRYATGGFPSTATERANPFLTKKK